MDVLRFRQFTTGVSFTMHDTLNKAWPSGRPFVKFINTRPNTWELDLNFIDFEASRFDKVIFDGCHHFERDLYKNILQDTELVQSTDWRATKIDGDTDRIVWGQPTLFPDTSHTVAVSVGPDPAYFFPLGRFRYPIEAPVHSAIVFPNTTTLFLAGSAGSSVIYTRGLTEKENDEQPR